MNTMMASPDTARSRRPDVKIPDVEINLREAFRTLDITQTTFAHLTGVTSRSVRRWVSGESDVPGWVPLLLNLMMTAPRKRWMRGME
jgi:DNA-binding transcriptional regulator YiaG